MSYYTIAAILIIGGVQAYYIYKLMKKEYYYVDHQTTCMRQQKEQDSPGRNDYLTRSTVPSYVKNRRPFSQKDILNNHHNDSIISQKQQEEIVLMELENEINKQRKQLLLAQKNLFEQELKVVRIHQNELLKSNNKQSLNETKSAFCKTRKDDDIVRRLGIFSVDDSSIEHKSYSSSSNDTHYKTQSSENSNSNSSEV